jgi:uncharacterized membrane protein YecN with MAPEG domain
MSNELRPDDLGEVWRRQKVEHTQMTIDEIRAKARKFQRKILFRNFREYAAIALVVVFFGATMGKYTPLMRAAAGLMIAGGLYVAYQLHRRGSAKTLAGDLAPASCLDFHRRELERQRDLVLNVWSWYLGPMIPGLAFMVVAAGLANPGHLKRVWLFVSAYSAVVALAFYLVARLNRRAAHRLQRRIDELDAMRG